MKTLLLIITLSLLTSCGFDDPYDPFNGSFNTKVEYKVTGTCSSAFVTLNNASGGTSQETVNVPHTFTYNDYNDDWVYISAQNQGSTGSITVEIYVNGNKIKSSSSSGAYVIATASASI